MPDLAFTPENGRLALATALWDQCSFRIRCPHCPGNPTSPGFTKDQGGSRTILHSKRRLWQCQWSNSVVAKKAADAPRCPRASCRLYIDLAQQQLPTAEFLAIVTQVCAPLEPDTVEFQTLQAYTKTDRETSQPTTTTEAASVDTSLPSAPDTPGSSTTQVDSSQLGQPAASDAACPRVHITRQIPQKRSAEDELPPRLAPHLREAASCAPGEAFRWTQEQLTVLVKMSGEWQRQLDVLHIFLASSSPQQPPPSTETSPLPTPGFATRPEFATATSPPNTSSTRSHVSSMPPLDTSSVGSRLSPPALPRTPPLLVIPCTYPDDSSSPLPVPLLNPRAEIPSTSEEPSSSITEPAARHSVTDRWREDVTREFQRAWVRPKPVPTPTSQSPAPDKIKHAASLVTWFRNVAGGSEGTLQRREIRQQAKTDGVANEFQRLLTRGALINTYTKKAATQATVSPHELKCSDRR